MTNASSPVSIARLTVGDGFRFGFGLSLAALFVSAGAWMLVHLLLGVAFVQPMAG